MNENQNMQDIQKEASSTDVNAEVNQMNVAEPATTNQTIQKKTKKRIGRTIFNLITILLFLLIIGEAALGIINMQKIRNDEKPVWCLSNTKTETELKTVTECHLGLYKIIKTDTSKKSTTSLVPFFLNE